MSKRVLFVAHGRKHDPGNPGYADLHPTYFESAVHVDANPKCRPDHVLDVTSPQAHAFFRAEFDRIYLIYAPYTIIRSHQFWRNAHNWLKRDGIVMTVLPDIIAEKTKDTAFARKICSRTYGLFPLPKKSFVEKPAEPAIVLEKRF
jgi:hypothetical protein